MITVLTKHATQAILNSASDRRQRCCCFANSASRLSRSSLRSPRRRQLQAAAVRKRIPLPRDLSDEFDDDRDIQEEQEEQPDYDYEPEPEEEPEEGKALYNKAQHCIVQLLKQLLIFEASSSVAQRIWAWSRTRKGIRQSS